MTNDPRNINTNEFFALQGEKKIEFLLQFAVLAPSTHNSQPWLFAVTPDKCAIYKDASLKIPYADPEGRDMYISLGCAIENLSLATKAYGVEISISYGPFEDKDMVAEIFFVFPKGETHSCDQKTLDAIRRRINVRGVFKDEKVKDAFITHLKTKIYPEYADTQVTPHFLTDSVQIGQFADITRDAMKEIYHNAEFRKEMSSWMNHTLTRKKKGIPGWALKMAFLASFIIPTMVKYFDMGDKLGSLNKKSISSAPLVVVFTAPTNDQMSWLNIGRVAERTMIECFKDEYQSSIFVASIEIGEYYKQVQSLVGTNDRPQFILAIGKIDSLHKPTPRFSVHDKMRGI